MSESKLTTGPYLDVKIHGVYDTVTKKVVKVSLDPSEIDMEIVLLGERPTLRECVMEVTLLLDSVPV
jgi:hypothetical protein